MTVSTRLVVATALLAVLTTAMLAFGTAKSEAATGTWVRSFNGSCYSSAAKTTNDFNKIMLHLKERCSSTHSVRTTFKNCVVFGTAKEAVFTAIGSSNRKYVVMGFGYAACESIA